LAWAHAVALRRGGGGEAEIKGLTKIGGLSVRNDNDDLHLAFLLLMSLKSMTWVTLYEYRYRGVGGLIKDV